MHPAQPRGLARVSYAAVAYVAITVLVTWPVVRGLARDVAWDLGDSLLNMWILSWDCTQFRAILGGDVGRTATFFDANIFYPAPLTLAYSEHLIAQAVQIFPLYWATNNPILCYNILFLSTFVLSGLGVYLWVRELTGNPRAAFVAGLMFAFAPYRLAQASHLQVLSAQWMPFAFYGLRRYFVTGRLGPLVGAATAMVAQSLSCGYYLLYFTPFFVSYALWEIASRRAWRDWRRWRQLATTAMISLAVLVPFLLPYLAVRNRLGGRGLAEVAQFSADVYAYLTATVYLPFWGRILPTFSRAEGELFPGLLPVVLAVIGIGVWIAPAMSETRTTGLPAEASAEAGATRRTWVAPLSLAIAFVSLSVAAVLFYARRVVIDLGPARLRAGNVNRPLVIAAAAVLLAAATSQRVRSIIIRLARAPEAYLAIMLVAAWWLSLGPRPTTFGRPLQLASPYAFLFEHVPGFEGIRAPARFGMIVMLALAGLAGFGARAIDRGRAAGSVLIVAGLAFLAESTTVPFLVNGTTPLRGFVTPEARVHRPAEAPRVYAAAASLPNGSVLIEFPFGDPDYDLRAVYYSTTHWRPLVNGYSGFFPQEYGRYAALFNDMPRHAGLSLDALRETGATHAIVHEGAFLRGEGPAVSEWFRQAGAVESFREGKDVLFTLAKTGP